MRAVLFDLDGTIIDSSEGITKSVQYALKFYGIDEEDLTRLNVFIGPPLVYSFSTYYGFDKVKSREAVSKYRERYLTVGVYECSMYPGVREAILQLKEQGYLVAIASSKPENTCRVILEHLGILELFDEVVGATDDGKIDTKEEVLKELMRRWYDIPREEMCLIGDTVFDAEGARQVGIRSICVSYGFGDKEEMLKEGAEVICDTMEEVVEAIRRL